MLRTSTDILKSMKNRFYQTVRDFPSLEITDKRDSQIRLAEWLCRLPHHPWTPMACSTPAKSPLDEVSAIGKILNFNWSSPPFPATYETREDLQGEKGNGRKRSREKCHEMQITVDSLEESKSKSLGSYAIDDSIIPERRPRACDLDRTKTPRRLRNPQLQLLGVKQNSFTSGWWVESNVRLEVAPPPPPPQPPARENVSFRKCFLHFKGNRIDAEAVHIRFAIRPLAIKDYDASNNKE